MQGESAEARGGAAAEGGRHDFGARQLNDKLRKLHVSLGGNEVLFDGIKGVSPAWRARPRYCKTDGRRLKGQMLSEDACACVKLVTDSGKCRSFVSNVVFIGAAEPRLNERASIPLLSRRLREMGGKEGDRLRRYQPMGMFSSSTLLSSQAISGA